MTIISCAKDPGKPESFVKDPGYWSHDCLISVAMSPIHCDITVAYTPSPTHCDKTMGVYCDVIGQ